MTTERIDVLAVMDRVIELEQNWGDHVTANAVTQARAAMAELIEATKDFVEVRTHNGPRMHYGPAESERLHAALARVGGAK